MSSQELGSRPIKIHTMSHMILHLSLKECRANHSMRCVYSVRGVFGVHNTLGALITIALTKDISEPRICHSRWLWNHCLYGASKGVKLSPISCIHCLLEWRSPPLLLIG